MYFADRAEAGRSLGELLGERLRHLRVPDAIVVGIPGGGMPVAIEVAAALGAPLDVLVVQRLGVPFQLDVTTGAVAPNGVLAVNTHVLRPAGIEADDLADAEEHAREALGERMRRIRGRRAALPLRGRPVIIVDDGMTTGATAYAAGRAARDHGATYVLVAAPVASDRAVERVGAVADEVVRLETLADGTAVGGYYADFPPVPDDRTAVLLAGGGRPGGDPAPGTANTRSGNARPGTARAPGRLDVPPDAAGLVIAAYTSESAVHSPRHRRVAKHLRDAGLATLSLNLLTPQEELDWNRAGDAGLLAERLIARLEPLERIDSIQGLPLGLFATGTAAAAVLKVSAAAGPDAIAAIVCHDGRPDLAGPDLAQVRAPTLLIVAGRDRHLFELNRSAQQRLTCTSRLLTVPGAGHLLQEAGALPAMTDQVRAWFVTHLAGDPAVTAR
ncbi:phosphoribosyltransferase family protein [Dactylosporangium sp. NPDC051484]|uniref:phosphoribosyltransferase family protein n=1 Tax=Dactylosporangium sp. NPDC051484 TaxID=3154942 RepID=UPI00344F89AA